jgi:hypothetical protein
LFPGCLCSFPWFSFNSALVFSFCGVDEGELTNVSRPLLSFDRIRRGNAPSQGRQLLQLSAVSTRDDSRVREAQGLLLGQELLGAAKTSYFAALRQLCMNIERHSCSDTKCLCWQDLCYLPDMIGGCIFGDVNVAGFIVDDTLASCYPLCKPHCTYTLYGMWAPWSLNV